LGRLLLFLFSRFILHGSSKNYKLGFAIHRGLSAPKPPTKGLRPLNTSRRRDLNGTSGQLPPVALGLRKLEASGPRKPGKSRRGKLAFPYGIIPRLSPDALHPGWRLSAAGKKQNGRKLAFLSKQQREACSFTYQVFSAGVGPGRSPPWWGAGQSPAGFSPTNPNL
jgi:hypothetical protein